MLNLMFRLVRVAIVCVAATALLFLPVAQAAEADEDPSPGQSWLSSYQATTLATGRQVNGRMRAGDNFGAVSELDFKLAISGSNSAGNRQVLMHRYDSDCLELATRARLSADAFCDQLTLKYRNAGIDLGFFSHDANKRYQFTLNPVAGSVGAWRSIAVFGASAPELSLNQVRVSTGYRYDWSLAGAVNRYSQSLQLSDAMLRDMQLSATEGAVIALAEVLRSFNSYEFQRSDLPKTNPDYQATPYLGWGENPDSGCIFFFCFGDLGNANGGGGSSSGGQCDPRSSNFDPTVCPWDLTYVTWPISQRIHIVKIDNEHFRYSFGVSNNGPGNFVAPQDASGRVAFVSLIQIGNDQPLATATQSSGKCSKSHALDENSTVDPFTNTIVVGSPTVAGSSMWIIQPSLRCGTETGRPSGRYRLYVHIDPDNRFDYASNWGNNNIGKSLLWIHLRR